jgi:hypothetical protein
MVLGLPGPWTWRRLVRNFSNYVKIHSAPYSTGLETFISSAVISCSGADGKSPASHRRCLGSILGQSVWDMWWTKRCWDRFFSQYFRFPLHHSNNAPYQFIYHRHFIVLVVGTVSSKILTPWNRVFRGKLLVPNVVEKLPAFYGTRKFITVFTRARHFSVTAARWNESMSPHPVNDPF